MGAIVATRDRSVRVVQVTAGEALAAQLTEAGISAAADALRSGGYQRPTDEQYKRIADHVTRAALAAGLAIHAAGARYTDDELDQAALVTAHEVVREVLGPPPMAH
jgi:hypothetical protein